MEKAITNNAGFKIYKYCTWNIFPISGLTKKCIETIFISMFGRFSGLLSVLLNPMLKTVQFPASISHLNAGLTNVNANTFSLEIENNNNNW